MMIPRISAGINKNFCGEFHIKQSPCLVNDKNKIVIVHQEIEYRPYLHDTDEIQAKEKQDYTELLKSQSVIEIAGKKYKANCSCTIYDGPRLDYDRVANWNLSIAKPQKEQRGKGNSNNKGVK